jgi:VWFA-related protein
MKRACSLCGVILALLSLSGLEFFVAAQNSVPSGSTANLNPTTTTFKSKSILVEVPAVVTDKTGNHIHGLNKKDFRILENGKEKKIATFEEVTATNRPLMAAENPAGTYSNVSVSTEGRPALTIILFDEINTPLLEQDYARRQVVKYLANGLNSPQAIELMELGGKGVRRVAILADDPSPAINALKKVKKVRGDLPVMQISSPEPPVAADNRSSSFADLVRSPEGKTEKELQDFLSGNDAISAYFSRGDRLQETIQALLSIAWSVSGIPGRKSLIWATSSLPLYLDSPSAEPDPYFGAHLPSIYADPFAVEFSALYERAIEALNDAQISVYPVDARGVTPNALDSTIFSMKTLADMTGGRAFYGRNDLSTGFDRAAEDSSSYYVLGYYMNAQNTKPGWRKLKVRLEDRSAKVRARQGFFFGSTTLNPDFSRQADVNFALSSPFESTGVPMQVRWNPAPPEAQKQEKAEFAIVVPAANVVDLSDRNQFDVDFAWEADRNGSTEQRDGQRLKGNLDANSLAQVKKDGVFYKNALQLPPGEYQVHFVVRNNRSGQIGSVTAPLSIN